ncbi:hypothetical protein EMCRGX_G009888 [Ephydatia muelleri]
MAMVKSFNRLALLVPTEILEETTPQDRAKVISKYIKIALRCYKLRNYNSLKAILAGLHSGPVHRLEKTWKHVSTDRTRTLDQLTRLMSEEDNCILYREDLELQWSTHTPCIPFLGYFLTQVVFVDSFHELRGKRAPLVAQQSTTVYTELSAITVSMAPTYPEDVSATNKGSADHPDGSSTGKTNEPSCVLRTNSGSWEQYMRHQKHFGESHPLQRHRTMSEKYTPRDRLLDSSRGSSPDLDGAIPSHTLRRRGGETVPLLIGEVVGTGDLALHLQKMQLNSLGCCASVESRAAIRELIRTAKLNTEAESYKLSCKREPAQL